MSEKSSKTKHVIDDEEEKVVIPDEIRDDSDPFESFESFINGLGDWKEALGDFVTSPKMQNIFKRVKEEYKKGTCYPPKHLIFNAFK